MNSIRKCCVNFTHTAIVFAAVLLSACGGGASSSSLTVTPRVAAGAYHTVAIKSDGSLWAWGYNGSGQLGDGSTTDSWVPEQIGTGYTAIAPGATHTVALKSDGSLWAWGSNLCGQLGDGTTTNSLVPKQIGTGYTAIAAGDSYTLAIKSDGVLWTWGDSGCLSKYPQVIDPTPKQTGTGYSSITAGYGHNFAFKSDGSLWAWGANSNGELGDFLTTESFVPKPIANIYPASASIAAGFNHTVSLLIGGRLVTWGANKYGELGDGTTNNSVVPKLIGSGYTAIAAGLEHTVAVKSDGSLWTWGDDSWGQLGDGTTSATIPALIPNQIGTGYTSVAAGNFNTFAIKSDGSLWAWGYNFFGQLGDGTNTASSVPRQIFASGFSARTGEAIVIPFTTLGDNFNSDNSGMTTAQNVVIRDQKTWSDLWAKHTGRLDFPQPLPAVDFNKNMVLGVFAGSYPTNTCVGVTITKVSKINSDLTVEYRILTPVEYRILPPPVIACLDRLISNPISPSQMIMVPLSNGDVTFVKK